MSVTGGSGHKPRAVTASNQASSCRVFRQGTQMLSLQVPAAAKFVYLARKGFGQLARHLEVLLSGVVARVGSLRFSPLGAGHHSRPCSRPIRPGRNEPPSVVPQGDIVPFRIEATHHLCHLLSFFETANGSVLERLTVPGPKDTILPLQVRKRPNFEKEFWADFAAVAEQCTWGVGIHCRKVHPDALAGAPQMY